MMGVVSRDDVFLRKCDFFKNPAAKVVFMSKAALVSEKRDAGSESLFSVVIYSNWEFSDPGLRVGKLIFYCNL